VIGLASLALVLAAAAVPAFAQRAERGAATRPREELYKMVDAYIVSNLQESLGLSDDQFVKILPLVKRFQTERRTFFERRAELLQEMRRLLESGRATAPKLAELLKELRTIENEEPAIARKNADAIDAQLNTVQQAKLRILQAQVEQKIRELMNRVRQQSRQGRAREGEVEPQP
jgi:hypothetical protein